MPKDAAAAFDDPRLCPFLPMIYIAWADGDLEDDEIRGIRSRLQSFPDLDPECREILASWLDPATPPKPGELSRLLARLRDGAARMPIDERRSLSAFGFELARHGEVEPGPAERRALEEIEEALGLKSTDVAAHFRPRQRPPARPAPAAEPAFDVAAMTRRLDGGHHELRRELRELLTEERFRIPHGLGHTEYRERVLAWCRELAGRGYGAVSFPESCGGRDDLGAMIAVAETLGSGDLSLFTKFGVQFGLFGGSLHQLGTERHHRYLKEAGTLDLPGCFAMTESGHGSNVAELETLARYDASTEEFEIHTPHPGARKDYIGNAACHGRLATVFAQLEVDGDQHGVHAILVPIRDAEGRVLPGITIEDCGVKMGLNGVDNGRITFDQVRVPRENLLDRFAQVNAAGEYTSPIASPSRRFFTMLGTLVGGRVTVAHVGLSAAKAALAVAVRYGARRRQFGAEGRLETRLLDYPTHQRRLLPRLARTYALDFALEDLTRLYLEAGDDRRHVEARAAGLKAIVTWHATHTIQACREACGGNGYLAANRFADLKADTDVFTTFEGDNVVLLQLLGKSLLTNYKKQFHDIGVFTILRFLAGRAAKTLSDWSPVKPGLNAQELESREVQLQLVRWREDHLLATLAGRLKKRFDDGMDPFEAVLDCQNHLVTTARAHVERLVAERFAAAAEEAEPSLREILGQLADLHILSRIEADRVFFLAYGAFDRTTARRVRQVIDRHCRELAPQAVPLVEAFGIPEAVLGAPIAVDTRNPSLISDPTEPSP